MKTTLATLALALPLLSLACSAAPPSGPSGGEGEGSATLTADKAVVDAPRAGNGTAAIAVPAACAEDGRYYVTDATVVDHANEGRTWQRYVSPNLFTQAEASAYCASLKMGWLTAWRLPTVVELNSLKLNSSGLKGTPRSCSPAIDQAAFPATPAADFWTSTVRVAGDAMFVGFDDGRDHPSTLETQMNVRCVTDPS